MNKKKTYQLPLSEDVRASMRAGDELLLSGNCYTLRDASMERLTRSVQAGDAEALQLMKLLSGQLIFFAGPTPAHSGAPELPFGSIGPTTSKRMDAGQITLMPHGMLTALGKGGRSDAYKQASCKHGAIYLAAIGGAAAILAQHVISSEVVAWSDLGTEAVQCLELRDFPAVVAIDVCGGDVYAAYRKCSDDGDEGSPNQFFHCGQSSHRTGTFITFEGGEGCGKSTQIELIAQSLRTKGHEVLTLRDPGSSAISEAIRSILLDAGNSELSARSELFLYQAARAQLVSETIAPALARGAIVLCDRFSDSTTAYQGYGRELDIEQIEQMNLFATGNIVPDLTIVLDLPSEQGLARAAQTGTPDRLERENVEFHQRVREGFRAIAAACPDRVHVLDATRSKAAIAAQIQELVSRLGCDN
ncbi:MAG: dTMP kinase [Coriobacteriia bacterium]|nr:dTMP kinase [Coriobacteriia bacterium]MCL2606884.1 dTMP kinase [Coriobacteriia bacterium]